MPDRKSTASSVLDEIQFWEVPVSLPEGDFTAHIREPASTSLMQIMRQLHSGKYNKPFVLEDAEYRQLHLGLRYMQSRMSLDSPEQLSFAYTGEMMSFLLFQPKPQDILVIGLGGGSASKFCYQQLPDARITAVEIEQAVIDFAPLFNIPNPDQRFKILCADGASFVRDKMTMADVVLLDGCDRSGIAAPFREAAFYEKVRAKLKPRGVLVVNIVGSPRWTGKLKQQIDSVFSGRTLLLAGIEEKNQVLLALKDSKWPPDWASLKALASLLQIEHGLSFSHYCERLEVSALAAKARRRNLRVRK